jgi:hypothetical protein
MTMEVNILPSNSKISMVPNSLQIEQGDLQSKISTTSLE